MTARVLPLVEVTRRLAAAVAPAGHLLVVGHAPSEQSHRLSAAKHRAMGVAEDLLPGLPEELEPLVVEQRPPVVSREGRSLAVDDSTLFARRRA